MDTGMVVDSGDAPDGTLHGNGGEEGIGADGGGDWPDGGGGGGARMEAEGSGTAAGAAASGVGPGNGGEEEMAMMVDEEEGEGALYAVVDQMSASFHFLRAFEARVRAARARAMRQWSAAARADRERRQRAWVLALLMRKAADERRREAFAYWTAVSRVQEEHELYGMLLPGEMDPLTPVRSEAEPESDASGVPTSPQANQSASVEVEDVDEEDTDAGSSVAAPQHTLSGDQSPPRTTHSGSVHSRTPSTVAASPSQEAGDQDAGREQSQDDEPVDEHERQLRDLRNNKRLRAVFERHFARASWHRTAAGHAFSRLLAHALHLRYVRTHRKMTIFKTKSDALEQLRAHDAGQPVEPKRPVAMAFDSPLAPTNFGAVAAAAPPGGQARRDEGVREDDPAYSSSVDQPDASPPPYEDDDDEDEDATATETEATASEQGTDAAFPPQANEADDTPMDEGGRDSAPDTENAERKGEEVEEAKEETPSTPTTSTAAAGTKSLGTDGGGHDIDSVVNNRTTRLIEANAQLVQTNSAITDRLNAAQREQGELQKHLSTLVSAQQEALSTMRAMRTERSQLALLAGAFHVNVILGLRLMHRVGVLQCTLPPKRMRDSDTKPTSALWWRLLQPLGMHGMAFKRWRDATVYAHRAPVPDEDDPQHQAAAAAAALPGIPAHLQPQVKEQQEEFVHGLLTDRITAVASERDTFKMQTQDLNAKLLRSSHEAMRLRRSALALKGVLDSLMGRATRAGVALPVADMSVVRAFDEEIVRELNGDVAMIEERGQAQEQEQRTHPQRNTLEDRPGNDQVAALTATDPAAASGALKDVPLPAAQAMPGDEEKSREDSGPLSVRASPTEGSVEHSRPSQQQGEATTPSAAMNDHADVLQAYFRNGAAQGHTASMTVAEHHARFQQQQKQAQRLLAHGGAESKSPPPAGGRPGSADRTYRSSYSGQFQADPATTHWRPGILEVMEREAESVQRIFEMSSALKEQQDKSKNNTSFPGRATNMAGAVEVEDQFVTGPATGDTAHQDGAEDSGREEKAVRSRAPLTPARRGPAQHVSPAQRFRRALDAAAPGPGSMSVSVERNQASGALGMPVADTDRDYPGTPGARGQGAMTNVKRGGEERNGTPTLTVGVVPTPLPAVSPAALLYEVQQFASDVPVLFSPMGPDSAPAAAKIAAGEEPHHTDGSTETKHPEDLRTLVEVLKSEEDVQVLLSEIRKPACWGLFQEQEAPLRGLFGEFAKVGRTVIPPTLPISSQSGRRRTRAARRASDGGGDMDAVDNANPHDSSKGGSPGSGSAGGKPPTAAEALSPEQAAELLCWERYPKGHMDETLFVRALCYLGVCPYMMPPATARHVFQCCTRFASTFSAAAATAAIAPLLVNSPRASQVAGEPSSHAAATSSVAAGAGMTVAAVQECSAGGVSPVLEGPTIDFNMFVAALGLVACTHPFLQGIVGAARRVLARVVGNDEDAVRAVIADDVTDDHSGSYTRDEDAERPEDADQLFDEAMVDFALTHELAAADRRYAASEACVTVDWALTLQDPDSFTTQQRRLNEPMTHTLSMTAQQYLLSRGNDRRACEPGAWTRVAMLGMGRLTVRERLELLFAFSGKRFVRLVRPMPVILGSTLVEDALWGLFEYCNAMHQTPATDNSRVGPWPTVRYTSIPRLVRDFQLTPVFGPHGSPRTQAGPQGNLSSWLSLLCNQVVRQRKEATEALGEAARDRKQQRTSTGAFHAVGGGSGSSKPSSPFRKATRMTPATAENCALLSKKKRLAFSEFLEILNELSSDEATRPELMEPFGEEWTAGTLRVRNAAQHELAMLAVHRLHSLQNMCCEVLSAS